MKTFLFPRVFRLIGWMLFVPTLILGILLFSDSLCIDGIAETIAIDTAIIGIALGSIFIGCSRERIEDEMTGTIRLNALLTSLYSYVVFLVIWTLAVNGMTYLYVMAASIVMLPMIFVVRFRYEMYKFYKMKSDEEQG